jgi:hypothetical protein
MLAPCTRSHSGSLFATLVALVLSLSISSPEASRVRQVNLEEIVESAERVFSGRCTEVRAERDPATGLDVQLVTFEVHRAVKGQLGESVTIRMLGGGELLGSGAGDVAGFTRFAPGEEVVLFLYGESSAGLTSPVGLGQGKFSVIEDKQGRKIALNALGNRGLMRGLSAEAAGQLGTELSSLQDGEGPSSTALLDGVERLVAHDAAGAGDP